MPHAADQGSTGTQHQDVRACLAPQRRGPAPSSPCVCHRPCAAAAACPQVFKRVGPAAVRLLLIPGLTEAAVTGALSMPLLGLPVMWGYTLGFILKAVGCVFGGGGGGRGCFTQTRMHWGRGRRAPCQQAQRHVRQAAGPGASAVALGCPACDPRHSRALAVWRVRGAPPLHRPAIVITTMHEVQKQRLGVAKGIPSIIVASASLDDLVAITGAAGGRRVTGGGNKRLTRRKRLAAS